MTMTVPRIPNRNWVRAIQHAEGIRYFANHDNTLFKVQPKTTMGKNNVQHQVVGLFKSFAELDEFIADAINSCWEGFPSTPNDNTRDMLANGYKRHRHRPERMNFKSKLRDQFEAGLYIRPLSSTSKLDYVGPFLNDDEPDLWLKWVNK